MKVKMFMFLALIVGCLHIVTVRAFAQVNASVWEGLFANSVGSFETDNPKEFMIHSAMFALCTPGSEYNKQCNADSIGAHWDEKTNFLSIDIPEMWNGLYKFEGYCEEDGNRLKYVFFFRFIPRALSLGDVMGRYGHDYLQVVTTQDFKRLYGYVLRSKMTPPLEGPLSSFQPVKKNRKVMLTFESHDKVFVDSLRVGVTIDR